MTVRENPSAGRVLLFGFVVIVGLMVGRSFAQPASAPALPPSTQPAPEVEVGRRIRDALAMLDADGRLSTAVCVDSAGLFIVNGHAPAVGSEVRLTLDPAGTKTRRAWARVVWIDRTTGLTLLYCPSAAGMPVIELAATDAPPKSPVVAAGFGIVSLPNVRASDSVSFVRLLTGTGEMPAAPATGKPPAPVLPTASAELIAAGGFRGGSVLLDDKARLLGLVIPDFQAGRGPGLPLRLTVPVSGIRTALSTPRIHFAPPSIGIADRFKPMTVDATVFRPAVARAAGANDGAPAVELTLASPGEAPRTVRAVAVAAAAGAIAKPTASVLPYRLTFAPFAGPPVLKMEANINGAAVNGSSSDRQIKVGDRTVPLSQLKLVLRGQARMLDGTILRGDVGGLGTMTPADAGKPVDLAQADRIVLESATQVPYTVTAVIDGAAGVVRGEAAGKISIGDVEPPSTSIPPRPPRPTPPMDLVAVPEPVVTNLRLAGAPRTESGVRVVPVLLPVTIGAIREPAMVWSRNGQALYQMQPDPRSNADVTVRRISIPALVEERKIQLTGASMTLSAEGLLVAATDRVWVLDEQTLEVRRMIVLGPGNYASWLTCGQDAKTAYSMTAPLGVPWIRVLDLASGRYVRDVRVDLPPEPARADALPGQMDWSSQAGVTTSPRVSPDGRWVYVVTNHRIVRYAAANDDLTLAQVGPPADGNVTLMQLSPDGKWLVVAATADHKKMMAGQDQPTVRVFAAADVSTEVCRLPLVGSNLPTPAVSTSKAFVHTRDKLSVFDLATGKPDTVVPPPGGPVLAHPDGLRMFQTTPRELRWVELPGAVNVYDPNAKPQADPMVGPQGPTPRVTGTPLAGVRKNVGAAAVTPLRIDADSLLPAMPFSSDSRSLFLLDVRGLLRKINVATLAEESRLEIGAACADLARTADGLLVLTHPAGELLLVDEATLAIRKRIAVLPDAVAASVATAVTEADKTLRLRPEVDPFPRIGAVRIVTSANSRLAIVVIAASEQQFAVVDLAEGRRVNELYPISARRPDALRSPFLKRDKSGQLSQAWVDMGFERNWKPIMTTDGKRVILSRSREAYVFEVEGTNLVRVSDAKEGDIATGIFAVSPDGHYALRSPRSVRQEEKLPTGATRSLAVNEFDVLPIADLTAAPVATLVADDRFIGGSRPLPVAFDAAGRRVYTLRDAGLLTAYGAGGVRVAEYPIDPLGVATAQGHRYALARAVSAQPGGNLVFALTDRELYCVVPPATAGLPPGPFDAKWLTKPVDVGAAAPIDAGRFPKPVTATRALAGRTIAVGKGAVTPVSLEAAALLEDIAFAPDGKSFLVAEKTGVVRQLNFPALAEIRRLEVKLAIRSVGVSRAGVVIHVPDVQELWLLDPATLAVLRSVSIPGAKSVVVSPALPIALIALPDRSVSIVNLESTEVIGPITVAQLKKDAVAAGRYRDNAAFGGLDRPAISPDGKYLLGSDESQGTARYRVAIDDRGGVRLEWEQRGESKLGDRVEFTADSRLFAVPDANGNWRRDHYPAGIGIYLFGIGDLDRPISVIPQGVAALGFDVAKGIVYAEASPYGLRAHDLATIHRLPEHSLLPPERLPPPRQGAKPDLSDPLLALRQIRRIVPHPEGTSLLVLTAERLLRVEPPGIAARTPPAASSVKPIPASALKRLPRGVTDNLWSDDGASIYVVIERERIQRLDPDTLAVKAEYRHRNVHGAVRGIAWSKRGLLADTLGEGNALLVLDPNTLKEQAKVPLPRLLSTGVVCSAASNVAFYFGTDAISAVDLSTGRVVSRPPKELRKAARFVSPGTLPRELDLAGGRPFMTADGTYVITTSYGRPCRLKVEGTELVWEETGPAAGKAIVTSPDGKLLAVVGAAEKPGDDGMTALHSIADLQKPLAMIPTSPKAGALVFAGADKVLVAGDGDTLAAFDLKGKPLAVYGLPPAPPPPGNQDLREMVGPILMDRNTRLASPSTGGRLALWRHQPPAGAVILDLRAEAGRP